MRLKGRHPLRLRRLSFPPELIDRRVARLQRVLRQLHQRFRRLELTRLQCLLLGSALIREAFSQAEADIQAYLERHGLVYAGNRASLDLGLAEALASWQRVVRDLSSPQQLQVKRFDVVAGHKCTCSEYRVLEAASSGYWGTYNGLMRRIDSLAQDLYFKTVNNAFRMVASEPSNGVRWLFWVLAADDRVCDLCIEKARGGREGYYSTSWFLPKIPVHPNCRCQLQLVMFDPFVV